MTKKYFVVAGNTDKNGNFNSDEFWLNEEGFSTLNEAVECAETHWNHLAASDKAKQKVEIREVEGSDDSEIEENMYSYYDIVKEFIV